MQFNSNIITSYDSGTIISMASCALPVKHDLGHQHVLQRRQCLGVIHRVVALESLVEVGEGRLEVLLLSRMQNA